ncbi:MAG TPA: hypothetical protein VHH34_18620, partial [Pseudonocardiaceae bacterium]|nr:hypothetical protein [Pseudonocardiaceae bacterium]
MTVGWGCDLHQPAGQDCHWCTQQGELFPGPRPLRTAKANKITVRPPAKENGSTDRQLADAQKR